MIKKTEQKCPGKSIIIFPVEILEILQVKPPFPVIELFFLPVVYLLMCFVIKPTNQVINVLPLCYSVMH